MTILSEDLVEATAALGKTRLELRLAYQTADVPYAYVLIDVSELFPGKEMEFRRQWSEKKGALYVKWVEERPKRIRADLERRRMIKPFKVTV